MAMKPKTTSRSKRRTHPRLRAFLNAAKKQRDILKRTNPAAAAAYWDKRYVRAAVEGLT